MQGRFLDFKDLNLENRLLDAIKSVGYIHPTPIQEKAIPIALEGKDVLGLAQTGTGKTAGFLLPILQRLMNGKLRSPKALILSPTRELADYISNRFN